MKQQKIIHLPFDTYCAVVQNSVGSRMFRNFYAKVDGKKTDIMKNGELSCAFFASFLLYLFRLIKEPHATVDGTIKDLRASGWKGVKKPKLGSVLIWEAQKGNRHIGFYMGGTKAVSNSTKLGYPAKHHWTFGSARKVELILSHPKLK